MSLIISYQNLFIDCSDLIMEYTVE